MKVKYHENTTASFPRHLFIVKVTQHDRDAREYNYNYIKALQYYEVYTNIYNIIINSRAYNHRN